MKKESEVTNVLIYAVLSIVPLFSGFWESYLLSKKNVMNIFNSGLNQRLNFGYFWITMWSDTYVYFDVLFSQYTYSKYPDVLKQQDKSVITSARELKTQLCSGLHWLLARNFLE